MKEEVAEKDEETGRKKEECERSEHGPLICEFQYTESNPQFPVRARASAFLPS